MIVYKVAHPWIQPTALNIITSDHLCILPPLGSPIGRIVRHMDPLSTYTTTVEKLGLALGGFTASSPTCNK